MVAELSSLAFTSNRVSRVESRLARKSDFSPQKVRDAVRAFVSPVPTVFNGGKAHAKANLDETI